MVVSRLVRRMMSCAVSVMLLLSMITAGMAATAPSADAAGTVLFNQPFHDNTVDGPAGSVSLPTAPTGTNAACLTASGNATKNPLASCSSATDSQGSGKLRFTRAVDDQEGGVFASTSLPTSQGLDLTFNSYQYGGNGADGIAFVLAAVNPADPDIPSAIGQPGGSLGYSALNSKHQRPERRLPGRRLRRVRQLQQQFRGIGLHRPGQHHEPNARPGRRARPR